MGLDLIYTIWTGEMKLQLELIIFSFFLFPLHYMRSSLPSIILLTLQRHNVKQRFHVKSPPRPPARILETATSLSKCARTGGGGLFKSTRRMKMPFLSSLLSHFRSCFHELCAAAAAATNASSGSKLRLEQNSNGVTTDKTQPEQMHHILCVNTQLVGGGGKDRKCSNAFLEEMRTGAERCMRVNGKIRHVY